MVTLTATMRGHADLGTAFPGSGDEAERDAAEADAGERDEARRECVEGLGDKQERCTPDQPRPGEQQPVVGFEGVAVRAFGGEGGRGHGRGSLAVDAARKRVEFGREVAGRSCAGDQRRRNRAAIGAAKPGRSGEERSPSESISVTSSYDAEAGADRRWRIAVRVTGSITQNSAIPMRS